MRTTHRLFALASAAVLLAGADAPHPDKAQVALFVLLLGVTAAFTVALGLPVALLLHAFRRGFVDAERRAVERRATACVLVGAGLFAAVLLLAAALKPRAPALAWFVVALSAAWFYVGFAGCARRQGERMLGASEDSSALRPLVLGWLARAGLFAVPVAWPFIGLWLVVVAFGAPLVAMFDRTATSDAPPVT